MYPFWSLTDWFIVLRCNCFLISYSRVWKSVLLGQLLCLLLCTISVLCQILVENYSVKIPTGKQIHQTNTLKLLDFKRRKLENKKSLFWLNIDLKDCRFDKIHTDGTEYRSENTDVTKYKRFDKYIFGKSKAKVQIWTNTFTGTKYRFDEIQEMKYKSDKIRTGQNTYLTIQPRQIYNIEGLQKTDNFRFHRGGTKKLVFYK